MLSIHYHWNALFTIATSRILRQIFSNSTVYCITSFLSFFFPDKVPMRWSQNTHVRIRSWDWNAKIPWRSEYTRQNSDAWSLETPSVHIKTLVIWTARRQIRGIKWLRGARTDASVQSEQIAHILGIHAPGLTSIWTLYMVVVSINFVFYSSNLRSLYKRR